MPVVKVQFLYVLYIKLIIKLDKIKRQIQTNSDCPENNGTDINRPVCVQVGVLICLPKVAKMACRRSKHDAVFLLSVYTKLT